MKKLWLRLWRGYGYCTTCNAHDQEPCKWLYPCRGRESYEKFLERYSLILSEHYGYTILPNQVYKYEKDKEKNGYDPT